MALRFGPIQQVAFVTRSIHDSMAFYTHRLGVGSWFMTERSAFVECRYRGEECTMALSAALASWGSVQIELVQQLCDTPSIFRDWMQRPFEREQQQHVGHWLDDYDDAMQRAQDTGFVVEQDGVTLWGRFAYLVHPENPDQVVEFTDATPRRRAFNQAIADAAVGWDGASPVRSFADAVRLSEAV